MNTVTIQLTDEHLLKLQETATHLGMSLEELVLKSVEELLERSEVTFKEATDYVLQKNSELYQRLA
ncbi:DNA-binding protein [Scytonema hofmannii PCC 7110]|uniref:DNA-binding protein n=1 Tax=Scytonema hofmannii PCC 7110 TaxID=128403 RepID=A0A139X5S3_9CYAN|nr:hypothetical protein [Scytonema hofmannii]KYC40040.1 DNA-binding protein [Scytonema hofmannii PCC 7110]